MHPLAPHTLPLFIPGSDNSDPFLVGTAIFLIAAVTAFGLLFLRLHTLPERLTHRGKKLQFKIVAVLALLALLTHTHVFWVAALLLALIDFPDISAPMRRIAGSTEKMAGIPPGGGDTLAEQQASSSAEPAASGPGRTSINKEIQANANGPTRSEA